MKSNFFAGEKRGTKISSDSTKKEAFSGISLKKYSQTLIFKKKYVKMRVIIM